MLYKVLKGPDSHSCAYYFWTGWPIMVQTEVGDVGIIIKKMTRIDDDRVVIAGHTDIGNVPYHATITVNPHRADHTKGFINVED